MRLMDALTFIIDDGIEAARADYTRPDQRLKRDGAIRGFEECRGRDAASLARLLAEANARAQEAFNDQAEDYWYWRCRALEVEWVANVLSAILLNQGLPVIVPPTARGALKAAAIVGVASR